MVPDFLPGENLADPNHPFHEVWTKWNIHHSAELENPESDSDKKEEDIKETKENKLDIEEKR